GGRINADLNVRNLDATPSGHLRAALHSISLQATQHAVRQEANQVAISGIVNGTADASWTGSLNSVRVRSDLMVSAAAKSASRVASTSPSQIPVDGVIHATYEGTRTAFTLRQSTLHIPSAALTADGEVSNHSSLRLQVTATDLPQLAPIAGSPTLTATVRGSLTKPQLSGDFSAHNLSVQGSEWRSAQTSLQASPSQFAVANGTLVSAQRGRASFNATVALQDWHYLPGNSFKGNLSVQ